MTAIDRFMVEWQRELEIKQATWIAIARSALVTKDEATIKASRDAYRDFMRHLAMEDLDPPTDGSWCADDLW